MVGLNARGGGDPITERYARPPLLFFLRDWSRKAFFSFVVGEFLGVPDFRTPNLLPKRGDWEHINNTYHNSCTPNVPYFPYSEVPTQRFLKIRKNIVVFIENAEH